MLFHIPLRPPFYKNLSYYTSFTYFSLPLFKYSFPSYLYIIGAIILTYIFVLPSFTYVLQSMILLHTYFFFFKCISATYYSITPPTPVRASPARWVEVRVHVFLLDMHKTFYYIMILQSWLKRFHEINEHIQYSVIIVIILLSHYLICR
jgi:hypothetical protein